MLATVDHKKIMTSQAPTVSVLMAVYNGERYVAETLESILQQTFSDFECIIVDDGSTDATSHILQRYAALDPRIRLLRNGQNQGISVASNRAVTAARGRYIAITDADDLSMPDRLDKQVTFLDEHPVIGIVGTKIQLIDSRGQRLPLMDARPIPPGVVGWMLFFRCCVAHGSAMVRREVYQQVQGYDPAYDYGFDYDFWLRARAIAQIANLPDTLLAVRVHPASASQRHRQRQQHYALLAQQRAIHTFLGKPITPDGIQALSPINKTATLQGAYQAATLLGELYRVYIQSVSLSIGEQRQIQKNLNKQRCYLLLKVAHIPKIAATALGGNFSRFSRFANFMRF